MGVPIRVLLLAEACNPSWTSIPLEGYQYARALSRHPDLQVTVATHVRNRHAIEEQPIEGVELVHFVDNEFLARPLHRIGRLLRGGDGLSWTTEVAMAWPSYMVFERMVHRRFASALNRGEFDLVHRVTPVTPTMGSPLSGMTRVPMVVGPLNGGLPWPLQYPNLRRREREWLVPVRGAYKLLPYHRSTYRNLAGVIAGSRHTASEIPGNYAGLRFYLPENGLDPDRFPIAESWSEPTPGERFRFITVGRLVPYKGMDLVLEAMAGSELLRTSAGLDLVGQGPEGDRLRSLARELGLEDVVNFVGFEPQKALAARMLRSQAFAFPSLREFGGAVVLEAMASGLPAIVVDYGGPGELVSDDCAIRIPMAGREVLVPELRRSMEALVLDHDRCRSMSEAAVRRVREEFTWSTKAERIVAMYQQIIGHN
jgi:glycosyltransferase involved in cell wall biosynthesis